MKQPLIPKRDHAKMRYAHRIENHTARFLDNARRCRTTATGLVRGCKHAQWRTPADIKRDYRHASFVGNNRAVFNIKGNDYRLIVLVEFQKGRSFIRFVGTHAEYDRINAESI
ncbi:MAG: type II toxin-antitoxin system HigB family toxin [Caldilineaceae bacterium]